MRGVETEDDALRSVREQGLFDEAVWEEAEQPTPHVTRRARRSGIAQFESPARFIETSSNRKLSPVDALEVRGGRRALEPRFPFCSSTYASIEATCSGACAFKAGGCYAKAGYTGLVNRRMDAAARGKTALEVAEEEAHLVDGSFRGGPVPQDGARGGRDLRLHVGGDALDGACAVALGRAVDRWRRRGGGDAWSYTHGWRSIARVLWRSISVLASVEVASDVELARERAYASAIVVQRFPRGHRVFSLPGTTARVVPCPAEVGRVTCVECRLCFDDRELLRRNLAIGFSVHGLAGTAARRALRVLNNEPERQTEMSFGGER